MKTHYWIIAAIVGAGVYFLFFRSKSDDVKKFDTVTGMASTAPTNQIQGQAPSAAVLASISGNGVAAVPATYSELAQTFTMHI